MCINVHVQCYSSLIKIQCVVHLCKSVCGISQGIYLLYIYFICNGAQYNIHKGTSYIKCKIVFTLKVQSNEVTSYLNHIIHWCYFYKGFSLGNPPPPLLCHISIVSYCASKGGL